MCVLHEASGTLLSEYRELFVLQGFRSVSKQLMGRDDKVVLQHPKHLHFENLSAWRQASKKMEGGEVGRERKG